MGFYRPDRRRLPPGVHGVGQPAARCERGRPRDVHAERAIGRVPSRMRSRRPADIPEWLAIGEDMWVNHRWRELGLDMRFAPDAVVALAICGRRSTRPGRNTSGTRAATRRPGCTRNATPCGSACTAGSAAALASRRRVAEGCWPPREPWRTRARRSRGPGAGCRIPRERAAATARRARAHGLDRHREDGGLRAVGSGRPRAESALRRRRSRRRTCGRAGPRRPCAVGAAGGA